MELLRAPGLQGGEAALLCTGARTHDMPGMLAAGGADLCRVHLGAMFAVGWFSLRGALLAGFRWG